MQRLTACAVANLCVSAHNQRLLIECNGIKPLVALANSAADPELASQCMLGLGVGLEPELASQCMRGL